MRVYELAKELKVEPRQIIRELGEMGLEIDNEMSQLAPEIAEDLRRRITSQRSEIIEERRVTSRVIRRRRKKIAPEPEPEPPAEPEPAPAPQAPQAEAPEPAPEPQPEPPADQPPPEPQAPPAEEKPEPAPPKAREKEPKPEKKRRKKKKEERFEPARIISRPSTPPPGPPTPSIPLEVAAPPAAEKPKPKRKKGRKDDIPDDEVLLRKVGVGRRKEVLERSDLYDTPPKRTKRKGAKKARRPEPTTPKAIKRRIKIAEAITVGELAKQMGIKATEVVARLMSMGMMVTLNQALDAEEAAIVASEFGFEVEKVGFEEEALLKPIPDRPEDLKPRPPVVTVMGHVDHGKTTLLDYIRKSNVAEGEAGGITQKIGAYNVQLPDGQRVVFIDTPGHEAFTQMRARGAQVTDIVVLVVAADDGVMQQTVEAINHAKAAGVPIVVAVNKIDVPGADPQKVRRELAEHGLVPEEWGGENIFVDISAKTGQGVDQLLEMILLQAEVLELKANPDKPARGRVLEARLDKGRGPVATVLVQEGTLRKGEPFVCGVHAGRVRAMFDDRGRQVAEAGPATPVEVQGLGGMAAAGEELVVVDSDKTAKRIAEHRQRKAREAELSAKRKVGLEALMAQMAQGEVKELKVVLKADSQGSVEAVREALGKLGSEEVRVDVIHAAAGAITESDVMLASASEAIIVGFNVRPTGKVAEMAEAEKVEVRTYDVIYELIEDMTAALAGLLTPVVEEEVIGRAEVRQTFRIPKVGMIAGCFVTSGKVQRGAGARLLREGVVVATTRIASLKRFKDDVKEVAQGYECGIGLENFNDIKVGDEIEVFVERELTPEL